MEKSKNSPQITCVFPRKIDQSIVSCLPMASYGGEISIVQTDEEAKAAVAEISKETLLGFDTESRPSFKRDQHYPVSILQLGGKSKVWIFRLGALQDSLAEIFAILANPGIKKVGVAVNGDISALRKLLDFEPQNVEDISVKTRDIGIINTGLRNLAALFCAVRISKSAQMSNWSADKLTEKQIKYAATDAWISRKLYLAVEPVYNSKRYALEPERPKKTSKLKKIRDIIKRLFSF